FDEGLCVLRLLVLEACGHIGRESVHAVGILAPAPVVSEDVVEHHVRHGVPSPLGDLDTSMVPAPGPTASGAVLCGELLAWRIWGRTTSSTHTWNRSACWVFDQIGRASWRERVALQL